MIPGSTPRFLVVADQLGGQCSYSGSHQLGRFLESSPEVMVLHPADSRPRRLVGKLYSLMRGWPARDQSRTYTVIAATWAMFRHRSLELMYFALGEDHLPLLRHPRYRRPIIATMQMPVSVVKPLPKVGCVDTIVLFSSNSTEFYTGALGSRQTVVIRYGVNTDFFTPGPPMLIPRTSILVVGRFLRDFPKTVETVLLLAARHPACFFDFIVTGLTWNSPEFERIRTLPNARWHDSVDDETLRRLYREAVCQLAVFRDCTANNAIVESLACGLPIVTTEVGGVRDYGAGTVYPLAADSTAEALVNLCGRYLGDPAWRDTISRAVRKFAEEELSWPVIARFHLALFEQVSRYHAQRQDGA